MAAYPYRFPARYRPPRRHRGPYRRRRSRDDRAWVAVLIGVAAAAGVSATHPHTAAGPATEAGAGIPAGLPAPASSDLSTRTGWARALLAAESAPATACNLNAVTEWEIREGGGFGNQAAGNPLNVNPGPDAGWPGREVIGAWAFPDAQTGLRYTIATLDNGYYTGIIAALRDGNSAQAVCDAIMASPWAASRYGGTLTATC